MFERYERADYLYGWITYEVEKRNRPLDNFVVSDEDLARLRSGWTFPTGRPPEWIAAARWLDEQLRKETIEIKLEHLEESFNKSASRIDGWTATLAPPEMVPVKIVRHEKPHCRYYGPTPTLAEMPIPVEPEYAPKEPGALKFYAKQVSDAQNTLRRQVQRVVREWPTCSVTGRDVALCIYSDNGVLYAYFDCECDHD